MSRLKIFQSVVGQRCHAPYSTPRWSKDLMRIGVFGVLLVMSACTMPATSIPVPRPIVNHAGARIRADHEHMKEVNDWVTREQLNIEEDPSFWVIGSRSIEDTFPWEGMSISQDTVTVRIPLGGQDATLVYQIYGHLHLMVTMGRQEEWLPEAPTADGYELERAIVGRVADAWILGRTVFDTTPFDPLDELSFAKDAGFLDAFIFTARPREFAVSRSDWARENPGETDRYRDWFIETFNREPPGIRSN